MDSAVEQEVYNYIKFGLGIDYDFQYSNVSSILSNQYRNLPLTKSILQQLGKQKSIEEISETLFTKLRKSSDVNRSDDINKKYTAKNGVLIPSISNGYLECAGRVGIASSILSELDIKHLVTGAPGHTFVIIRVNDGSWIYADYNQETYFYFKDPGLTNKNNYGNSVKISLKRQMPSTKYLNYGAAYIEFFGLGPKNALIFSFYSNLSSLSRDSEYVGYEIENIEPVRTKLREIKYKQTSELGKEFFKFDQDSPQKDKEIELLNRISKEKVGELFKKNKSEFVEELANEIERSKPYRVVYIDPSNRSDLKRYAESVYRNFRPEEFKGVY